VGETVPIGAADLLGCGMWSQESWTLLGNFRKMKNNLPVRGSLKGLNYITASARSFYNMTQVNLSLLFMGSL